MFAFQHGGHGHEHLHKDSHRHDELITGKASSRQILPGVFLHIVDTLGSIGVIISAILMQKYDLMMADPICSMLIALLIAVSVVPLLRESIGILMQRTPPSLDHVLPDCYQRPNKGPRASLWQVQHLQGVNNTHNIFTQVGIRQLYVQIDVADV